MVFALPDNNPNQIFGGTFLKGGVGTGIYAGRINDLDQNSEVRNELWYGTPFTIGIASKMMRDSHVRRSYHSIVDPIVSANWDFKPAGKEAKDLEIAAFCKWIFIDRLNWTRTLRDILLFIRDGFSLVEVQEGTCSVDKAKFPNHPGGGIAACVSSFHARSSWTVDRWIQNADDPTRLDAILQWLPGSDVEQAGFHEIKADRLLRWTWEQEGANYTGLAPLRSAYGPWKTKLLLMIVEAIRHEREHTGTPTLTLPPDASEDLVREAQTILSELRAHEKGYLILPAGYEFKFSTTDTTTNIGETIERCNFDIAHNLGTGFMLLGKSGTAGSYALASTQSGQYEISLDNYVSFVSAGFNVGADGWSIVERMVRLNYGPDVGIPQLIARNMPTRNWANILPIVNNLTMTGHITPDEPTEAFIRDVTYLPPHDPSTARDTPKQEAASAQVLKAEGMTNDQVAPAKDANAVAGGNGNV